MNLQKLMITICLLYCFIGGCKQTVEPRLTLKREDTTLYHLVRCLHERVSAATAKPRSSSHGA